MNLVHDHGWFLEPWPRLDAHSAPLIEGVGDANGVRKLTIEFRKI